jgi:hypothetical protein
MKYILVAMTVMLSGCGAAYDFAKYAYHECSQDMSHCR